MLFMTVSWHRTICDFADRPMVAGIDQLRLLPTDFSRMAQASSPYFFFHSA